MIPNTWPSVERMEQEAKAARRERIATAAMQGLLTSETTDDCYVEGELVKHAVSLADALIAELDKVSP